MSLGSLDLRLTNLDRTGQPGARSTLAARTWHPAAFPGDRFSERQVGTRDNPVEARTTCLSLRNLLRWQYPGRGNVVPAEPEEPAASPEPRNAVPYAPVTARRRRRSKRSLARTQGWLSGSSEG